MGGGRSVDEDHEALVTVFAGSPQDAELLRAALEGSGIDATTESSGVGGAYPVNVGDLGQTRVLVRARDRDAAREIIRAGDEGMLDDSSNGTARPEGARYALLAIAILVLVLLILALAEGNAVT